MMTLHDKLVEIMKKIMAEDGNIKITGHPDGLYLIRTYDTPTGKGQSKLFLLHDECKFLINQFHRIYMTEDK